MSPFEIIMLICFGAAWPFSIYKSIKSKSARGKSVLFLFVIMLGYSAGIVHKLVHHFDGVIALYALNLLMVALDTMLYFRNSRLEKKTTIERSNP